MIKLIKQDLESFLCLIGDRRPALSRGDLLRDRKRLALREAADYLFLARGDRSYLFPLEEVYTPDSRAYLCWTADAPLPRVPVDAFYLHVADASHGPRGSVTLLDYGTASCIYTQKGNKKIRKPQAANQTALIFDRRAAARLLSINSIRRLCWS